MDIQTFEQVISEQNPHWDNTPYEHDFLRSHNDNVLNDLTLNEIQIITGIRRCGKSTLIQTIINHLMTAYDPKSLLYINFDDPNYNNVCNDSAALYHIITASEKLSGTRVKILLLDEVQNVEAWEKYVKSMYDSKRFKKIIVTGSNADLLNSDYASLLTGRYIETRLYPMTYKEILLNNGITDKLQLIKQKPLALRLLDKMMNFGGFPRVNQIEKEPQRRKVLKSYYETILLKDCIKDHKVRDTRTLMNLAHYLISNVATRYSYNSLSKAVQSNENTVQKFIQHFENAYFINELKQFSYSLKTQARLEKKTYCIDNGLVTATSFNFFDNISTLMENLVYTELRKVSEENLFFHNDNNECDFILHNINHPKAIQVCHTLTHENRSREINGLLSVIDKFSIQEGFIITYDQEERITDNIQAIPFWKFFSFELPAL